MPLGRSAGIWDTRLSVHRYEIAALTPGGATPSTRGDRWRRSHGSRGNGRSVISAPRQPFIGTEELRGVDPAIRLSRVLGGVERAPAARGVGPGIHRGNDAARVSASHASRHG